MKQKVVLVHGYNKSSKDMEVLKKNLELLSYECISIDLPLTFKSFEDNSLIFEGKIEELVSKLNVSEKFNFVGHSTGGLILRKFIADGKLLDRVGKCVLIATPNNGSELADIVGKKAAVFLKIFKILDALQSEKVKLLNLANSSNIEIGAIAGNKSNLLLSRFLSDENDGMVRTKSVCYEGLKDFIVLPYGHRDIHYQQETSFLIESFFKYGRFDIDNLKMSE